MSIDDKTIGHGGFTIMSNGDTGKIALMIESCKIDEVADAVSLFGRELDKVQAVGCDMVSGYLKVCAEELPKAQVVIDKFHVLQYVYDSVLDVRSNIKKELSGNLSKGKIKTEQDKEILQKSDVLKHCRYRLTQSPDKWSEAGREAMYDVFRTHKQLEKVYLLSQNFKKWYARENCVKLKAEIESELHRWYREVKQADIKELNSAVRIIRKHENEILNFFRSGQSNAKAER